MPLEKDRFVPSVKTHEASQWDSLEDLLLQRQDNQLEAFESEMEGSFNNPTSPGPATGQGEARAELDPIPRKGCLTVLAIL